MIRWLLALLGLGIIVRTKEGYFVKSEKRDAKGKRRNLGGPYKSLGEAKKRLEQVEYFKHKG